MIIVRFGSPEEHAMSLRPEEIPPVPEETRRVAQAAFPRGNTSMRMRDELGAIYDDHLFAPVFPAPGQPAAPPWRLALPTVRQLAEGLSDRQAADAVRSRIDWKYALSLELTDPGFDHTVLSEFRTRLVAGQAELLLLDTFLARVRERGLLKTRGRQRPDSTHVLAAIRVLNRLELVGETLRHALNCLAVVAPDWLQTPSPPLPLAGAGDLVPRRFQCDWLLLAERGKGQWQNEALEPGGGNVLPGGSHPRLEFNGCPTRPS
jgi:transposase